MDHSAWGAGGGGAAPAARRPHGRASRPGQDREPDRVSPRFRRVWGVGRSSVARGLRAGFFSERRSTFVRSSSCIRDESRDRERLTPLESIDEVSVVAAPGWTTFMVQSAIVDHCEASGDRVAILDAARGASPNAVVEHREQTTRGAFGRRRQESTPASSRARRTSSAR